MKVFYMFISGIALLCLEGFGVELPWPNVNGVLVAASLIILALILAIFKPAQNQRPLHERFPELKELNEAHLPISHHGVDGVEQ